LLNRFAKDHLPIGPWGHMAPWSNSLERAARLG
jgi:hypothetical protein